MNEPKHRSPIRVIPDFELSAETRAVMHRAVRAFLVEFNHLSAKVEKPNMEATGKQSGAMEIAMRTYLYMCDNLGAVDGADVKRFVDSQIDKTWQEFLGEKRKELGDRDKG